MNANKKIHDAKLIEWAALFREQAESGLKVIDWCASKGISKNTYVSPLLQVPYTNISFMR